MKKLIFILLKIAEISLIPIAYYACYWLGMLYHYLAGVLYGYSDFDYVVLTYEKWEIALVGAGITFILAIIISFFICGLPSLLYKWIDKNKEWSKKIYDKISKKQEVNEDAVRVLIRDEGLRLSDNWTKEDNSIGYATGCVFYRREFEEGYALFTDYNIDTNEKLENMFMLITCRFIQNGETKQKYVSKCFTIFKTFALDEISSEEYDKLLEDVNKSHEVIAKHLLENKVKDAFK